MSFTNAFGGSTLQAADVAYRAVSLTANVSLVWPPLSTSPTDFVARIMNVTPNAGSRTITMPPANQVSQGFDVIYANPGSFTYTVLDYDGNTIATVAPSEYVYLYITENSTEAGSWDSFVYGVGTSAADAAALAGYGLTAISTTLNAQHPITTKNTNYSIATSDRAALLVWTGGAGTFTLPLAANALQGFFVEIRNGGTGTLTIAASGGDTADGSTSIVLQPTESLIMHSDGTSAWYSVGRGRATQFNFSQLTKAVTGGSTTLTNTEAANVIQTYTGILASNQTVVLPGVVQVYYVQNQTTGAFSLTFQTPTPGTVVSVPTGQNAILVSDGTNIVNASNTLSGLSSFTLNAGSAAAPSLNFSGDLDTGIFSPGPNILGFSAGGSEVGRMTVNGYAAPNGTVSLPSYSFTASASTGLYSPSSNQMAIAANGVQVVSFNSSGVNFPLVFNEAKGASIASASTVNLDTATGNTVHITGTASISTFTLAQGARRTLIFDGACTLVYGAANLVPGGINRTVAAGDIATVIADTANNVRYETLTNINGTAVIVGGLTLIATVTPTASASVNFLTTFTSQYDNYLIIIDGVKPASDDQLQIRYANAGSADSGSNYYSQAFGTTATASATAFTSGTAATSAGIGVSVYINVLNANSTTTGKVSSMIGALQSSAAPNYASVARHSTYVAANAISGFNLTWVSGSNFSAVGTITVYAYQKS